MTSFRKTEIAQRLNEWLFSGRYNPPKEFRGNEKAEKAEAEALLGVLLRFAPQADVTPFVNRVLDQLEYQLKFRVWPNKGELGAVCSNIRKGARAGHDGSTEVSGPDMRPVAIIARRMQRGDPVGEGWLYGADACELIAAGLVDQATMEAYRSGAFLARRQAYGEAAALAWEAEAKRRHDEARADHRQRAAA